MVNQQYYTGVLRKFRGSVRKKRSATRREFAPRQRPSALSEKQFLSGKCAQTSTLLNISCAMQLVLVSKSEQMR
ncbi:hypothetical protein TNCV_4719351 [Trichonephila clavipes]|uniref:Uncharacterized protein n=1 Tax=Trichonephila clavipes TaxID=2585209 RepID=A0A8X6W6F2_TRICX|nr:hypothetical protein TNCV_4719351 [Trichonephila clavipes]